MLLRIDIDGSPTEFQFAWEALRKGHEPCFLWAYHRAKSTERDLAVVYRHVLQVPGAGIVTVYVGEGDSLNGPKKYCLLQQYSHGGHGASRVKVRDYLETRSEAGWTEILKLSKPPVDLSDNRERKFIQTTLIAAYYWEHRNLATRGVSVPDFLNEPR